MKNSYLFFLLLLILLVLAGVMDVAAQSGGGYDTSWNTIDGGGIFFSSGDNYHLGGVIGQPEAGVLMSGSDYSIQGGFLVGGVIFFHIMLPIVLR